MLIICLFLTFSEQTLIKRKSDTSEAHPSINERIQNSSKNVFIETNMTDSKEAGEINMNQKPKKVCFGVCNNCLEYDKCEDMELTDTFDDNNFTDEQNQQSDNKSEANHTINESRQNQKSNDTSNDDSFIDEQDQQSDNQSEANHTINESMQNLKSSDSSDNDYSTDEKNQQSRRHTFDHSSSTDEEIRNHQKKLNLKFLILA